MFGWIHQWTHLVWCSLFGKIIICWLSFFHRHTLIQIVYFFLCEFWQIVSFKELICFIFSCLLVSFGQSPLKTMQIPHYIVIILKNVLSGLFVYNKSVESINQFNFSDSIYQSLYLKHLELADMILKPTCTTLWTRVSHLTFLSFIFFFCLMVLQGLNEIKS